MRTCRDVLRRHGARLLVLLAGWFVISLAACATLPDLDEIRAMPAREPVEVLGPRGPVSPARRDAVTRRLEGRSDLLARHLDLMEAADGPPLVLGNQVRLLIDGPAAYKAMFQAIRDARDHVHLETYILNDDEIGRKLGDLLIDKRREGVPVRILYDSVGSISTPKEFFRRLTDAGIELAEFNPVNPAKGRWNPNHRDHRKILITDGKVAYTGGINISSVYSSGSVRRPRKKSPVEEGWRDTQIEVRGPAAAEFQKLFVENWNRQAGAPVADGRLYPQGEPQGGKIVQVLGSSPKDRLNTIYVSLIGAIEHAERSVHLTMAYFVPDRRTLRALADAAQRGVDVQVILPGFSDFAGVFHAGRASYDELLAAGVKIHERRDALLHAKTAVIDGVWSTVGSANMDFRSFLHNDEVNVIVLDEEFGRQMEAMFEQDLGRATRIDPAHWSERPPHLRLLEWFARLWQYWL